MNFLRRIFSVCHSFEVALTFLLQVDLRQLSVNYGDLYVGFLYGNPFQRSLRVQVLNLLMFTNETCCLLLAVCVWNFDQFIQFEMLCPLWLRINEFVDGNSSFKSRWWGCICKSVDGDRIFEPRWWGNSVDGDSVFESRWWDYICNSVDGGSVFESRWWGSIYNFSFESFDADSIYKPRWWGCIYNFVLRGKDEKEKYGLKFVRLVKYQPRVVFTEC